VVLRAAGLPFTGAKARLPGPWESVPGRPDMDTLQPGEAQQVNIPAPSTPLGTRRRRGRPPMVVDARGGRT